MNRTRSDSRYLELESCSRRIVMATDPESFSVCVETNTSRPETHSPSLSLSPLFLPCNRCSYFTVHLPSPSLLSFSSSISPSRSSRNNGTVEIIVSSVRSKSTPRSRAYMIARVSFLETVCPFRILFSPGATNMSRIHETIGSERNDPRSGSGEKRHQRFRQSGEGEVFVSFRSFSPIFFFPSGQSRTSWNVLKEIRRKGGRRGKDRREREREREKERKKELCSVKHPARIVGSL